MERHSLHSICGNKVKSEKVLNVRFDYLFSKVHMMFDDVTSSFNVAQRCCS